MKSKIKKPTTAQSITLLVAVMFSFFVTAGVSARENTYCVGDYYNGFDRDCGGHLQPACNSGAACNSGHISWTGSPFPDVIDCPTISGCTPIPIIGGCIPYSENIPDVTITKGCYNEIPDCNNCGGNGQPPCPDSPLSCVGCDAGLSLESTTGLCLTPSTVGALCDIDVGCADSLLCNPENSQCFTEAQAGDSCLGLPCAAGLQCTLAFECSHEPALEGETCDVTAPCSDELYCAPGIPQRCKVAKKPGESCGVTQGQCMDGSFCNIVGGVLGTGKCYPDPFASEITTAQCESFYSPQVAADAASNSDAATYSAGVTGVLLLDAFTDANGVAYGADGEYGCFRSHCDGVEIDIAISTFIADGKYLAYDNIAGSADVIVAEAGIPSTDFGVAYADVSSQGEFIGSETSLTLGVGLSPSPISAGFYTCETMLETIYGDGGGNTNPPEPGGFPSPPAALYRSFGALEFDGVDDQIGTANESQNALLQVTEGLTLEAWVRASTAGQTATLLSKPGEYELALDNGELVYALGNTTPGWATSHTTGNQTLDDLRWHHVALTYENLGSSYQARVYLDGQLVHTVAATGPIGDALPVDNAFTAGGNSNGFFSGFLNDVKVWSVPRTQVEIFSTMNNVPNAQSPGLLATWSLGEPNGTTLADGSPANVELQTDTFGSASTPERADDARQVLGGALHFDGVDDYVAIDTPEFIDSLTMSNAVTLEAWVYPTGPGSHPGSGGIIASKEGEYYMARNAAGQLFFALANDAPGWSSVVTSVALPEREWHHVGMTYDAGEAVVRIYLDGELADTHAASGLLTDFHEDRDQFRIGSRQRDERLGSTPMLFEGLIDEVRVWHLARSEADFATDYDQVLDATVQIGLEGYFRFDENSTSIAFDSSSNRHHGELGLGSSWRAPNRVDTSIYLNYPRSLLVGMCTSEGCVLDYDSDSVSDYSDNCLLVSNPSQTDADLDGYGNHCDADFDNNGITNFVDFARFASVFLTDDALADLDANGTVNFLDYAMAIPMFLGTPGPSAVREN